MNELHPPFRGFLRTFAALSFFGVAFGYVEAAVVVYLRASYEPLHQRLYPDRRADDLFPILRPEQLEAAGPAYSKRLVVELGREAATLLMLAGFALAVGRNFRQWFAAFLVGFGIWDIFFYVSLRLLTGWPASPFDWDLLFLLPLPWVGPVLAPVIVALSMIAAGSFILWRESIGRPVRLALSHWAAMVSGGAIIVLAFCWDFRHVLRGGYPQAFNWPIFALGEMLGVLAFVHAVIAPKFVDAARMERAHLSPQPTLRDLR